MNIARPSATSGRERAKLSCSALEAKRDWDGAISEFREAVRLKPDSATAHYGLGIALESKGDRAGALEEYNAACKLEPNDPTPCKKYQELSRQ